MYSVIALAMAESGTKTAKTIHILVTVASLVIMCEPCESPGYMHTLQYNDIADLSFLQPLLSTVDVSVLQNVALQMLFLQFLQMSAVLT